MDRLKPLDIWETSEHGGPVLRDSEDAVRFGMASHEDMEACNALLIERSNLRKDYMVLKDDISYFSEKLSEIAFRLQFTNDAIREIVRIRRKLMIIKNPDDLIKMPCLFCKQTLHDHSENGDCPR